MPNIDDSAILQGIDSSIRIKLFKQIADGHIADQTRNPGLEEQFIEQLMVVDAQRELTNRLRNRLHTLQADTDVDADVLTEFRKQVSSTIIQLAAMEDKKEAIGKTLADIQRRLRELDQAGTAPD